MLVKIDLILYLENETHKLFMAFETQITKSWQDDHT